MSSVGNTSEKKEDIFIEFRIAADSTRGRSFTFFFFFQRSIVWERNAREYDFRGSRKSTECTMFEF